MKPALIVHGHFYQPPRENPWTAIVDGEPSAAPYHDWNQRIHRECYRPNGWARILDDGGATLAIVSNYRRMSFNFGPTLASWLQEHEPGTYRRILDADKQSLREHGGHGNAIAQAYNHAILSLLADRDLRTQIRWGLIDFRHRFGRDAEGMWLPETACDRRTLGALIDEGVRFTVLAPQQAARIKDDKGWRDAAGIDPRKPYRFMHPDGSGRSLTLFFFDRPLSTAIAFEGLLTSSRALVDRFEQAWGGAGVVQAVTDGETFGHHFRLGERCLAHALEVDAPRRGFWITNYGELLNELGPAEEVDLWLGQDGKGSSWSCAHGVGRWYRDCGCHTGGKSGWNQAWRTPLYDGMVLLRDAAAAFYEQAAGALCRDPWAMRDDYARLVVDRRADRAAFFEQHCGRRLGDADQERALSLLELSRSAMTIFTSCGWFFSELSGIEPMQVLRYAGRLCDQLRGAGAPDAEPHLCEVLATAKSNLPERGNGADLYREAVQSSRATPHTIAAHVCMRRLIGTSEPARAESDRVGSFRFAMLGDRQEETGRVRLAVSHLSVSDEQTGGKKELACCAVHFGGIDLHCLVKDFPGESAFSTAQEQVFSALAQGSLLTVLRVAEEQLGPDDYGIAHVLPSDRAPLSRAIFGELFDRYAAHFEAMFQDGQGSLRLFQQAGLPVPAELSAVAELALGRRFEQAIAALPPAEDETAYREALAIAEQARAFGCRLPTAAARERIEAGLTLQLRRVVAGDSEPERTGASTAVGACLGLLEVAGKLGVELDLERGQELLYDALKDGLVKSDGVLRLGDELGLSRKLL